MSAHTAETAGFSAGPEQEVCRACQAAVCFKHPSGHVIRPNPIGRHTFADRVMVGDVESCRAKLGDPLIFYHFLQLLGVGPLAEEWGKQVITQGKSVVELPHEEVIFQSAHNQLTAAQTTIDDPDKRGADSEAQMIAKLGDHELFPWITGIDPAPPKQPKYDAVVRVDYSHPLGSMLYEVKRIGNSGLVHVDAKSSFNHVFGYYREHTRSKKSLARVGLVQDGFWAINTNMSLKIEQFYTQVVTLLLITLGYFNQKGHWGKVFEHLDPVVVAAFNSQEELVDQYRSFFYEKK